MDKDTFEAVRYMVRTAHPGEFYADDEYCNAWGKVFNFVFEHVEQFDREENC